MSKNKDNPPKMTDTSKQSSDNVGVEIPEPEGKEKKVSVQAPVNACIRG